jgi:RHS repeat-associated protein
MNYFLAYRPKFTSPNIGGYRYFFNGQEADNEMFGEAALHSFEYRMHDARLGRFWSVDPLAAKYPWNSTYAFAENRVIDGRELEGLEVEFCTGEVVSAGGLGIYGWNYVKGHGTASDQIGVTYFRYKSKAKISNEESVAGILLFGLKYIYGIDILSKTFEESMSKGAITSIDATPIFGGSFDSREGDWYLGGSVSVGLGIAHTTTQSIIEKSFSMTYNEMEKFRKKIKETCLECEISVNTLSIYTINGDNYLHYYQEGDFFNGFQTKDIRTNIKMNNIGSEEKPQWQSVEYQKATKN